MIPFPSVRTFSAVVGWAAVGTLTAMAAGRQATPDFNQEVRPILAQHCFKCHGPDDKARKGGTRLDLRDAAIKESKSGAVPIVPGKPDESELVSRIMSKDEDEVMPPPATKHELTAEQKDVLKRWIAAGAEYRPHWAFVKPEAGEEVSNQLSVISNQLAGIGSSAPIRDPQSAIRNPIDGFIRQRLLSEHLSPSPEADRYTLCRRVYLDLIGLPPTPEEADAFVNDPAPDSYERLVDRLLASPHYGERWARKWLDLARYADTNGYEKDRERSIWPYRDWVIRALNADMPFDQFTIDQLAGDLLPNPTNDQLIATGFHRNTMLNEEGGIDPLEFRFNAMVDRVATTGTTWLGLTVGCAQCHTHKYDPILHTEYYRFMAFLNNADEPELDLGSSTGEAERQRNFQQAAELVRQLPEKWPVSEVQWQTLKPAGVVAASGETPRILDDGSALFAAAGPESDTYTIVIDSDASQTDRLRLEALADESLPSKGPGRTAHGNFVLSEIAVSVQPKAGSVDPVPVKIISAEADAEQDGFPVTAAFDGRENTGWAVHVPKKPLNTAKAATFHFEKPISFPGGARWTVRLVQAYGKQHTIGRVRLSLGAPADDGRSMTERRREAWEQAFAAWLKRERERAVAWTILRPTEAKSNMPFLKVQPDDSIFVSGDITKDDRYEVKFRNLPAGTTALRLEAMPDDRLPAHGPGLCYYEGPKGDFFLSEFQVLAGDRELRLARASESHAKARFTASLAIDGDPQTGWSCSDQLGQTHQAVFVLAEPLAAGGDVTVKMEFSRHYACSLGRFRIAATADPRGAEAHDVSQEAERLLLIPDAQLTDVQRQQLREQFLLSAPELASEAKRVRDLQQRGTGGQTTLVMRERPPENPRPTFVHNRGEYLQKKEQVEPGVPAFLPPLPSGAPKNRLTFAKWLVSPENPLTARVVVNRQWAAFFGAGLVRTLNDFGFQGEAPTHPELLDWLAVDFMKQGWSLKKLHRLIVTSATYRQSSRATPELLERDPQNRLLARGPRVRVDAEVVRDAALKASGLLSGKMYGRPVRPPQAPGVSEVAYGSPKWEESAGEDRYRRALYTFAKRTAPYAMFNTFDAPTGEVCVARREVSNTPLQSLTLLNDEVFVEASQALGSQAAARGGDDCDKASFLFRRCLIRPPRPAEMDKLTAFVGAQRERLAKGELKASDLAGPGEGSELERAAWSVVARAVLNLDEAITKN